jgi:mRNA-degrading endonuclease RelE of RelBE toxin-antitoxin system
MNYSIVVADTFKKDVKRLFKKYNSLKADIVEFIERLEDNPVQGTPLGKDCYKVRMAIKSKNKGKSGGSRVITCVKIIDETVFLLSIYDKSDKENILDDELDWLLKEAGLF